MRINSLFMAVAITAATLTFGSCSNKGTEQAQESETQTTEAPATETDLYNLVANELNLPADKPIVVDFNAEWCGPCKQFAPTFEAAAEKYAAEATFAEADVDKYESLATKLSITSIPAVMVFRQDDSPMTAIGQMNADEFDAFLRNAGIIK